jgi:hypothetical protein
MGFFPINAFICSAVGTDAAFDVPDKPVRDSALFFSCLLAYRAFDTTLRHLSVLLVYDRHMNPSLFWGFDIHDPMQWDFIDSAFINIFAWF